MTGKREKVSNSKVKACMFAQTKGLVTKKQKAFELKMKRFLNGLIC